MIMTVLLAGKMWVVATSPAGAKAPAHQTYDLLPTTANQVVAS